VNKLTKGQEEQNGSRKNDKKCGKISQVASMPRILLKREGNSGQLAKKKTRKWIQRDGRENEKKRQDRLENRANDSLKGLKKGKW